MDRSSERTERVSGSDACSLEEVAVSHLLIDQMPVSHAAPSSTPCTPKPDAQGTGAQRMEAYMFHSEITVCSSWYKAHRCSSNGNYIAAHQCLALFQASHI